MGENLVKDNIREIRKMNKEMIDPNLAKAPANLL